MRESDLGWVFSEIETPSCLRVRREEREREFLKSSVNTQFQDDLSVDATKDPMMRICYKYDFQNWFFNINTTLYFYGLKHNGFLGTKQLQNYNSFSDLAVIKSKKPEVILKINIYNKMNENTRKW